MLKQLVIIISIFVIFGSNIIAQDKPEEQTEETKQDSLVEQLNQVIQVTAVESTELKNLE